MAVQAARAVSYQGAGTVEFIADGAEGIHPDRIWFMEMNTRLQVEHPVTEAITGLDLVEWQLRVASGEPLPLGQDEIRLSGHAMEARLYAEDPEAGFLPSAGLLKRFHLPANARVDSGYEEGDTVGSHYDAMLAKLVCHADDRADAVRRLEQTCREVEVWPVKTNAAFLAKCLADKDFAAGDIDTGFVGRRLPDLGRKPEPSLALAASALSSQFDRDQTVVPAPWDGRDQAWGLRLNAPSVRAWRFFVDGAPRVAELGGPIDGTVAAWRSGDQWIMFQDGAAFSLRAEAELDPVASGSGDGVVRAPMPGRIVEVAVSQGEAVQAGQRLLVLEAMKMEHALTTPTSGTIAELSCQEGDQVAEGASLVKILADG